MSIPHEINGIKFTFDPTRPAHFVESKGWYVYTGKLEMDTTATEVHKALIGATFQGRVIKGVEMFAIEHQNHTPIGLAFEETMDI